MITRFLGNGVGSIQLSRKDGTFSREDYFKLSEMYQWYPLDSNYGFFCDTEGKVYIDSYAGIIKGLESYHIIPNVTYTLPSPGIEFIKEDNIRVENIMKQLGLPTWHDKVNKKDIEIAYIELGNHLDRLIGQAMSQHKLNSTFREATKFIKSNGQSQKSQALKNMPDELSRDFQDCGKMETMLGLMRKSVEADDDNRLFNSSLGSTN